MRNGDLRRGCRHWAALQVAEAFGIPDGSRELPRAWTLALRRLDAWWVDVSRRRSAEWCRQLPPELLWHFLGAYFRMAKMSEATGREIPLDESMRAALAVAALIGKSTKDSPASDFATRLLASRPPGTVASADAFAAVKDMGRKRLIRLGSKWVRRRGRRVRLAPENLPLSDFARVLRRAVLVAGQCPQSHKRGPVPVEEVAGRDDGQAAPSSQESKAAPRAALPGKRARPRRLTLDDLPAAARSVLLAARRKGGLWKVAARAAGARLLAFMSEQPVPRRLSVQALAGGKLVRTVRRQVETLLAAIAAAFVAQKSRP